MELNQHPAPERARTTELSPRSARRRRILALVAGTAILALVAAAGLWLGYPALQQAWAGRAERSAAQPEAPPAKAEADAAAMVDADPQRLIDREDVPPGSRFRVRLPEGLSAVALSISQRDPQAEAALTMDAGAGPAAVEGIDPSRSSANATVIVPVSGETLVVHSGAGGDLVVDLVGRFQGAAQARAGRFVQIEPAEVASLDTSRDGRTISVPVEAYGARPGTLAALIRVDATIGTRQEARVEVNPGSSGADQTLRWGPDSSGDPQRKGVALARVGEDGRFTVDYQHGSRISVQVLGYFTGDRAAESSDGLLRLDAIDGSFGQFT